MREIVDSILSGNYVRARELFEQKAEELFHEKLDNLKDEIASEYFTYSEDETLDEGNIQKQGRTKLVKIRIRAGKVQRRKKVSAVKGYTFKRGKFVRMTTQEKRNRKMGARKAKVKRRAKLSQSLRKRRMSIRKRTSLGL